MHTPSSFDPSARALVLGGGGSTGNAWLIGVLAGLAGAGVDVTRADVVVGTSAGATAAAQLTAAAPGELLDRALRVGPVPARAVSTRPVVGQLERTGRIIAAAADAADMRRRIGAAALEREPVPDEARLVGWRATVASRLTGAAWPSDSTLRITAVDAETGEPEVFDRGSGVDLIDAVAASCSSGGAYRIGARRLIDGGYRRNENADLAAGCGRVLVLSPFGGRSRHPAEWGMDLATQVAELRAGGSAVEVMMPDPDAEQLFGTGAMDLALRPVAARAGADHGAALAARIAAFWHAGGGPS